MTLRPFALLVLFLAACGTGNEARYLIEPEPVESKVRLVVGTLEVRDVSLPAYASEPDILAEAADGALYAQGDSVWADDPVQGVTSALVRVLSERTTATVAAEPWPLSDPAQVRLDVRVNRIYARADGTFVLSGQFAVASPDAVVREFVRSFDVRVPLSGEGGGAVAAAQSAAIAELGRLVAASLS